MADRIYLNAKFKEKDRVKALGARWDPQAGQWYVPDGLDLAAFASWLPAGAAAAPLSVAGAAISSVSRELGTQVIGVPLSRLLGGVAALVSNAFQEGVWTTAEVLKASVSKGHYYLELTERSPSGEVLAQARAVIWARSAQTLLAEFKRITGADLDAGIKVLIRAKPVFKSQYGFSLEVDGIDPSYTLGDLEARRRDIRERLKREGLFGQNRALPAPWDYTAVLVIAPERAAGLGDFAKEAQRLQAYGVCEFSYVHSRFQGEGAAAEVIAAIRSGLRSWSGSVLPDAVVIIRGGGAVNDLAWLNDYDLARCVCECPIPVLTGIGHERDDTSVDEVAHRKFDTPSKVVAGIEDVVRTRARDARALHELVLARSSAAVASAARATLRVREQVEHGARAALAHARTDLESTLMAVRHQSLSTIHDARGLSRETLDAVRGDARALVASAKHEVPALVAAVAMRATSTISNARHRADGLLPLVVERATSSVRGLQQRIEGAIHDTFQAAASIRQTRQRVDAMLPAILGRAALHARHAKGYTERAMLETAERAARAVTVVAERSKALFREIAGQGPQKTLRRGFAVVRTVEGKTVTTTEGLAPGIGIEVELRNGKITAIVGAVVGSTDKRGE